MKNDKAKVSENSYSVQGSRGNIMLLTLAIFYIKKPGHRIYYPLVYIYIYIYIVKGTCQLKIRWILSNKVPFLLLWPSKSIVMFLPLAISITKNSVIKYYTVVYIFSDIICFWHCFLIYSTFVFCITSQKVNLGEKENFLMLNVMTLAALL